MRLLGLSSSTVQIVVIMTGAIMLAALTGGTFLLARHWDGLRVRAAMRCLGLTSFDPVALVMAVAAWGVLVVFPFDGIRELIAVGVGKVPWLALPPWHFQAYAAFEQIPRPAAAFALVANIMGEELWFRGYLQNKLSFLGSSTWVWAGLLFTAYHVFQAPISYPNFAGALALSGLYALRRDLWACVLLHTLLQAPV